MSTLETQYKNFLKWNPNQNFTFEEWKEWHGKQILEAISEIKREPKQRLEKYSERFDNKDNEIVEGIFNPDTWGKRLVDDVPKQETLEEAYNKIYKSIDFTEFDFTSFAIGAKWQQERSYSEEEVITFGEFIFKHSLLTHTRGVKSLFEQFKKK